VTQTMKDVLSYVTIAMPIVLVVAHGAKSVAVMLHNHALATPDPRDERVTARILAVADWLDTVATAVAHVASLGVLRRRELNPTPSLERAEAEQTDPQTPRAKRGAA